MEENPFKEGDRVKLLANEKEDWPEEIATILGFSKKYPEMVTVVVDEEYLQENYDDGFRELLWEGNMEHLKE